MAKYHTVIQGEYLSSIAWQYNILEHQQILDHPENAEIKRRRRDPNVLYPGDRIFIPEPELKQESCGTDKRHHFVVKRPKQLLRIVVKDFDNKKIFNEAYTLKVLDADGEEHLYEGQTDHSGMLQQKIPIGSQHGELRITRLGYFWTLRIGHLDPLQDDNKAIYSGVSARLNNLGYGCEDGNEVSGSKLKAAVKVFQEKVLGRADTGGELDWETINALLKEHGC